MPLRIIHGGIGSKKSDMCVEEIRRMHEKFPSKHCIMLVPDHYSFETEKRFVKEFRGTGLNNIDVMTPRKMAVTYLSAKDLNYLSDSGRQMLISRAIREYCLEEENIPLIRTMKTQGFTGVMESLISEMKRYCVLPQMLMNSIEMTDNETLKNKLRAISVIYSKYNEFFESGNYTDSKDDLTRVAEYIRDDANFAENVCVWIDHFDEFLPQHIEILKAMLDRNVDVTISLNYLPNDENYIYMSETYNMIRSLMECVEDIECSESLMHVNSSEIRFLLLNYNNLKAQYDKEVKDISVFAGRDSYSEIEHTAGEILRLVREKGYRYRDIAVMCADTYEMGHIIKAVFDEYEIPYFSDEKIVLSDHPIAMQLLSVFDMFDEDWSYNSVLRYLRSGFIYDDEYRHIKQFDIDYIDNFALKYGIRGRKKWLDEKWVCEKDSFERVWDDVEEEEGEYESKLVNEIKDRLMQPLLELYKSVKKGKTARDYANVVFNFLENINMYGGLKKDVKSFEANGKLDEAQQFSEIWNLILEVLDQTVVTMADRQLTFSEYGEYIKAGLSKCEIKTIPSCIDSVCVGSVERSTAAPVKALFVTGAVSGTYPNEISDEGFLSNSDRYILKERCNITIAPDTKGQMRGQYFKVYKALAPVTDKLFLSYPVQNGEGKALRPSRMVIDIQRMFKNLKTHDNLITDFTDKSYISSPAATIHKLLINKSGKQDVTRNIEWETVYRWFKNHEEYKNKLELLEKAHRFGNGRTHIEKNTARLLFGSGDTTYSASRLNTYSKCPFSYFMKYGLNAEEQEISEIAAHDFGSYAHRFIQEFCVRVENGADTPEEKAKKWKNLSDEDRNLCIDTITNETKEKIKDFHAADEERRLNMIDRIAKTVRGSAAVVHKSLKKGRYTADGFEKEFDKIKIGDGIYIKGAVDRVDSYEDNDKEYIRIIDYKTGYTGFDIVNIYNRIDMQMVIYAIAVKKSEAEIRHRNTEISGIFYNKIKDEFVKSDNADLAGKEHVKNMRLDGVVFAPCTEDGSIDMESIYAVDEDARNSFENHEIYKSDFSPISITKGGKIAAGTVYTDKECQALMHHAAESVKYIDQEIKSGNIEVKPYEESKTLNACTWCEFKEACSFERENADVRKKLGTKEEAWRKIIEEYEGGGNNGMDK